MMLGAPVLLAQCVMCFRTAAAQQAARSAVLNKGILILLVPPFCVLGTILFMAWRRRAPSHFERTASRFEKRGAKNP